MEKNRYFKLAKIYFAVAIIFLFLSLVNTYPLITRLTTFQLGDGGDGPEFLWNFWWVNHALKNLESPYYTDYLFYPYGTELFLHSLSMLNCLISIPFQYLFNNLILAYNLVAIISFVLSGTAMFSLAYYLTKNKYASFIAGYAFAFSPYLMGHALGHLNLMTIWPLPFFILFFIKFHETPSLKNMLLSSFFLILATLGTEYYGIFMIVLAFIFECHYLASNKFKVKKKFLIKMSIIFIIFLLFMSPLIFGILSSNYSGKYYINKNAEQWSADVMTFFLPGTMQTFNFLKENIYWQELMSKNLVGAENQNFLGYTLLCFSIVSIYAALSKRTNYQLPNKGFWISLIIIGIVFAIGVKLKIFNTYFSINPPYYYIFKIFPFVPVSGRWVLLSNIGLCVLSAYGIDFVSKRISRQMPFYLIISILLACEFFYAPYPIVTYEVNDFYYKLANEKGDFALQDLSDAKTLGYWNSEGLHMYYQTIHEKKITGGRISKFNTDSYNKVKLLLQDDFKELKIKYTIYDFEENYSRGNTCEIIRPVYSDNDIFVFQNF